MYKFGFKNTALNTKGAISHKLLFQDVHGLQLYAISAWVANPGLDTRSSRRVHNMALYRSTRPNPQIRIHQWTVCSICTVLHTINFWAHTSWSLLCLWNFSTCVLSDKQLLAS